MARVASYRPNKPFGFKALVVYDNGMTHIPVRHNFKSPDAARAYALKWIAANDARQVVKRSYGESV